jgi:hypothetical protein
MNAQDLFDELSAPFPATYVEWRVGPTNKDKNNPKGQPLCYIDARTVMDRLDSVCGPDGWQCNYTPGVGGSIICNIAIRIEGDWIWKADGAGATDMEAEKGAISDAFKRAAVRWGIGRYLYELKAPWIEMEVKGNRDTFTIPAAAMNKLNDLYDEHCLKCGWGERSGVQAYRLMKKVVQEFVTDAASAQEFKGKNAAEIAQLPVAMRKHLNSILDRVGSTQREAA